MKVFLSWSGHRSKCVAELLNDWLRCVLQASRPWVSTRDIDRGALWFSEISEQLADTTLGVVCLTAENKQRPWILFEAGALAKGLTHGRVCTLLVDLLPTDVEDPLAQFNHTIPEKESMWGLIRTLNNALQPNALDDRVLQSVFETYWPQFESGFARILAETPTQPVVKRSEDSILAEVLASSRALTAKVRDLESRLEAFRPANALAAALASPSPALMARALERVRADQSATGNKLADLLGGAATAPVSENALARLIRGRDET
jgi:hypothetical protein